MRLTRARTFACAQVLDLDPENKDAARELLRCKRAQKEQNAKDAALFSKMWAKPAAKPAPAAAAADAPAPTPVDAA
jgi:hypothetical protein